MDRVPSQPVKPPPNLTRNGPFDLDRLLGHIDPAPAEESEAFVRHIDPAPAEESEAFVRHIYEQRRIDQSS